MAAAAPQPPQGPSSYRQYYGDNAKDPHGGDYGPLLSAFRAEDNPANAGALFASVLGSDPHHSSAFITVREEGGDCFFQLIHAVAKYPSIIGLPTPWDGKAYATTGDVVEGMTTVVQLPETAFEFSHAGLYENVPATVQRARELLVDNPDEPFVGPFADEDAQIRAIRTRTYFPLPHRYVPRILSRRLSVRDGFLDLTAAIEANGDDGPCSGLMEWLLLAITRSGANGSPNLVSAHPIVPLADESLLKHRKKVVVGHLPGLTTAGGPTAPVLTGLVGDLVQEQRQAREEAQARATLAAAPKSVAKALGAEVASTLLSVCQVASEDDLPAVWRQLAAAGKKDRQALEQALLQKARDLRMAEVAPVATPDLVKRVIGLQWAGMGIDDLSEGIQPFSVVLPDYVGSNAGVEAQRLAEAYDIMATTGTTTTLQDAQVMKTGKAIIPVDFSEARAHLVATMLLWSVLVGEEHPFVLAYGRFLRTYTGREYSFQNRLRGLGTSAPPAALFLRYVQLRTVTYWRAALNYRELPSAPNFLDLLDKVEMQDRSWIPNLPTKYWKPVMKPKDAGHWAGSISFPPGLDESSISTGGSRGTMSSLGQSTGTGSSGQSTGTGASGQSKEERTPQQPATNPAINAIFAPFAEKIRRMTFREAMAKGGGVPTVERQGKTVSMCLSYHLGGKCWSGCGRRDDHAAHTAEEDARLQAWCQTAYA